MWVNGTPGRIYSANTPVGPATEEDEGEAEEQEEEVEDRLMVGLVGVTRWSPAMQDHPHQFVSVFNAANSTDAKSICTWRTLV